MANCSHVSFDMSSVTCASNDELPTTNKPREIAICLSTSALLPPIPRRNIASCQEDLEQSRDGNRGLNWAFLRSIRRRGWTSPCTLLDRKKTVVSRLSANRVPLSVPIGRGGAFNRYRNAGFARSVVNAWTPRLKPCGLSMHFCGRAGRRQSRTGRGADGDARCAGGARAHGRALEDAKAIYPCGHHHERRRSRLRREGDDRGKHYLPREDTRSPQPDDQD